MHNKKSNVIKRLIIVILALVIIIAAASTFILIKKKYEIRQAQRLDFATMNATEYNCAFISMYSVNNYSAEDFYTYRGLPTILSTAPISELEEVSTYMITALQSGNHISHFYLGLDTQEIWVSSGRNETGLIQAMEQNLLPYITAHPDISFEILFSYPSLDYLVSLKDSEIDMILSCYRTMISGLDSYPNVTMYFPGSQEWLIANPGNYENEYNTNAIISQKIMLFTFCDRAFQITSANADVLLEQLTSLINKEQSTPASYADLSDYQIVFFGDSVIGNYSGSFSIPGVVSSLSGAECYNYAIGGSCATDSAELTSSFTEVAGRFLTGEQEITNGDKNFTYDAAKNLYFVINYGLNDYFTGSALENADNLYDAYTYSGALRSGIRSLKEVYPNAKFLLLTPNYCTYFTNGTEINSAVGGPHTDYVDAITRVAEELDCSLLNTTTALGLNADNASDLLLDGCHINENGRFQLGGHIISVIE